jgi:hypothetical protein
MPLDILNVVELRCQWVVDVNHNDLPVGLFLIEQCHDAENLDLFDLSRLGNQFSDLANVKWVIVTLCFGLWMNNIGVFPSLGECTVVP